MGHLETGLADLDGAVASFRTIEQDNPYADELLRDLASAQGNRALILAGLGQPQLALDALEESIRLLRDLRRKQPYDVTMANQLAIAVYKLGAFVAKSKPSDARRLAREAITLQEFVAQRTPDAISYQADLILSCHQLGSMLFQDGQLDTAVEVLRQGIEIGQQVITKAPLVLIYQSDLAAARNSLGRAFLSLGSDEAAIAEFEKAIALLERVVEVQGRRAEFLSSLAGIRFNLGLAQRGCERADASQATFRTAIRLQQEACAAAPGDDRLRQQLESMSRHFELDNAAAAPRAPAVLPAQLVEWERR
jgi:tetratricopeptide (TPR) repeat protein